MTNTPNSEEHVQGALIAGITRHDSRHLAELPLAKGYMIYGMVRRAKRFFDGRGRHLLDERELSDAEARLDVVLSLAAQAPLAASWSEPFHTL